MKRTFISIVIFAVLIGFAVCEFKIINRVVDTMESKVIELYNQLELNPQNIKTADNIIMVQEIEEYWNEKGSKLMILLPHNQINEMGAKVVSLKQHIYQNDYNMANTAAALILEQCKVFKQQLIPYPQNVL